MIENLNPNDYYTTLATRGFYETKIKGSKFIGFAYPILDKINADEIIENHRKEYYDATHNCFAYLINGGSEIFRYSDDGEPSGTAGRPIYQAIKHFNYRNVLVIVTRYFGGAKLGVGPLSRAYYDTAYAVLNSTPTKIVYIAKTLEITFDYTYVSAIKRHLEPVSVETKELYLDVVTFTAKILNSKFDDFNKNLIDLTQGKVIIKYL